MIVDKGITVAGVLRSADGVVLLLMCKLSKEGRIGVDDIGGAELWRLNDHGLNLMILLLLLLLLLLMMMLLLLLMCVIDKWGYFGHVP
jgi:hypothetical protein